jgi:hypothetical protein
MQQALLILLCGLPSLIYGVGMAYYVWFRPGDRWWLFFKPRWNFAVKASNRAAYAQIPLFLSFGAGGVAKAFQFEHVKVFGFLVLGFAALSFVFFLADWISPSED